MSNSNRAQAILLLQDGTIFQGTAIGKIGFTSGEICFNTGMTGYQEVFTDPSYTGQILVTTNDHIGNYGILETESESDRIRINGLVCKRYSFNSFSRKQATQSIDDYFTENSLVGIADVDTRQIVRHIRSKGAMNCIICSDGTPVEELMKRMAEVPDMNGLELSSMVTTPEFYTSGSDQSKYRIAVLDFGVKTNIIRCLNDRDCYTGIFPAKTPLVEILKFQPDGFMLSNGPGDPSAMPYAIETAKAMLETGIPMFGICLGNQILAQAVGLKTFKMHHGHRGLNHPVKNLLTGRSEITSQNHGFAVQPDASLEDTVEITHLNLNDNTVEGLRVKGKPAFAVQYHPEAAPGPHDARYLFDDFVNLIRQTQS